MSTKNAPSTVSTFMADDCLENCSSMVFDDATMAKRLPPDVLQRFKASLVSGEDTSEGDQKIIADTLFAWAREKGAVDFAHWFFPVRGGGGAVGGQVGAYKMDTLLDIDYSSKAPIKPFKACLPHERLFQGETDGSSFPNGGLRVTHTAAAFTSWDRSAPPVIWDKVLRIPCCFVTHYGKCIDDKTPLLRSADAVKTQGLRLLKNIKMFTDATSMYSYLGWEQEFFVIPAELFKKRPDLVNCGRTLFGKLPARHQQADLNYFAPVPFSVQMLLDKVQAEMIMVGCPMAVKHNEVAPGQHEMSPVFCVANVSADYNVLFMEMMNREAAKMGLQVLFHEKPFAGINGNGKHANWSVSTDTGVNFFYPGKTDEARSLFTIANACLSYGLCKYNELVRCSVAHAGNDHRLGAQEAPPAIISLYPGTGFEKHVEDVVAGGELHSFVAEKAKKDLGCAAANSIEAPVEDRNRTAPFPFCGNRYEFRACGSSQNCALPIMVCNVVMAAGMAHVSDLIEGGMSTRDAVAQVLKENKHVIFTGNGYSAEWPVEAEKRGLPNLNTTPKAIAEWNSEKNKKILETMGVFSPEETDARAESMYENYITTLSVEARTMIEMVETGIVPACAKDLSKYASFPKLAGERPALYDSIVDATDKLKALISQIHAEEEKGLPNAATFICDTLTPQMSAVRELVDKAEGLLEHSLYPYPTYGELLYSHHH
jgi:glutamine synthetase